MSHSGLTPRDWYGGSYLPHRERAAKVRGMRICCIVLGLAIVAGAGKAVDGVAHADTPLLFVVEGARDEARRFESRALPEQERRLLTWPEGVISLPDSAVLREAGVSGLAFALDASRVAAAGSGGRLALDHGRYDIDTPLYLGDGTATVLITAGSLEIDRFRIVYRRPAAGVGSRGTLFVLAGVALATALMLRLVRRRTQRP